MESQPLRPNMALALIAFTVVFGILLMFARSIQKDSSAFWSVSGAGLPTPPELQDPAAAPIVQPSQQAPAFLANSNTPTPDAPHPLPALRVEEKQHYVQAGETLNAIAQEYGVSLDMLITANGIVNPNLLEVGQLLTIPVPTPSVTGPGFKVIPDSELVYGPGSVDFNVEAFIQSKGGYLATYREEVEEKTMTGAQIVQQIAQDYSVGPRLLLAVLEYQSGWVTRPAPKQESIDYPLGLYNTWRKGLYYQLAWAANSLNRGFYLWRVNGAAGWLLADGTLVPVNATINAGTAGVQHMMAELDGYDTFLDSVGPQGLFNTYGTLFGDPFAFAFEPLLPLDLEQPALQLPFEPGKEWAFTGGPHGGWGDGSAWAALDFAPPGEALGCVQNDDWVVAAADGMIVRTGTGAVFQDIDYGNNPNDGKEQTGWVILYMHVESRDRIQPGQYVKAGELIGHPSCEGGVSTGTHVHLARKYNGEWISADQNLPFVLDGWVSKGDGYEYNGFLVREDQIVEAYAGRSSSNNISR